MNNEQILANAPEGATHYRLEGYYIPDKDPYYTLCTSTRSLDDIRRIVELKRERDERDREQQAKGIAEFLLDVDGRPKVFDSVSELVIEGVKRVQQLRKGVLV